jgi:hypothetical protein
MAFLENLNFINTFVSSCRAVFRLTSLRRSPAIALAVPDDTSKLTPSSKLKKENIYEKFLFLDLKQVGKMYIEARGPFVNYVSMLG